MIRILSNLRTPDIHILPTTSPLGRSGSMVPSILPFMEPFHILGSGSIGMFWASSIRSAFPSYPLAVLLRSHHKPQIIGNGSFDQTSKRKEVIVCTMQNRRPRLSSVPIEFIDEVDHHRRPPIRNLILATKAYQAVDAVESIIPRLRTSNNMQNETASCRIFVLSNGALDIRENLKGVLATHDDIPQPEWIMCTTTHGVVKEESEEGGPGVADDDDEEHMIHLSHIGNGRTFLGAHPAMAQLWDQSGLNASAIMDEFSSASDPMEVLLWKKLAGSCFCNPLTALWEVTNGELLQHHPDAPQIRKQVVAEVSNVAQAMNPTVPHQELSEAALDGFVEQVIQANLDNRSSMYHDVKRGRRTEVDSLNGYIVRKGQELGIDTPANEELLLRIREIVD